MKRFTILSAISLSLLGCNHREEAINQNAGAQKEEIRDSAKVAKQQVDNEARAEKARIDANAAAASSLLKNLLFRSQRLGWETVLENARGMDGPGF